MALREPPRYRATNQYSELGRAFMVILGLEDVSQFNEIVTALEQGRILWTTVM